MSREPIAAEAKTSHRLRDRIKRALTFSATFAALGGIILGVFEYHQRGRMVQARETMQQIDVWDQQGGARDAYRALARDVALKRALISEEDRALASTDADFRNNLRLSVTRQILELPENVDRLETVVYFFNRLSLCVEADLCDVVSAKVFFEDTLASFLDIFGPALTMIAEDQPGYTAALVQLQKEFAD